MNLTQVYLTPDCDTTVDRKFLVNYQRETTYIQIFIEDCIRNKKTSLGKFNRLVLSEDGDSSEDLSVVGNNALLISLDKTYQELKHAQSDREAHEYYVRKFLEGFTKLDAHFSCSFVEYLKPLIESQFKDNLFYEKKIASKRIDKFRLEFTSRYSRTSFSLVAKAFDKSKLIKSKSIYECEPDLFIAKFNVAKVVISNNDVIIINKINEATHNLKISDII